MEYALSGLSLTSAQRDAAKLARFIMATSPACKIVNEREIYQTKGFHPLRDAKHRKQVFAALEGAGWLRPANASTGGRCSEDWNVNPTLWEK
jgi:hypothetical protein